MFVGITSYKINANQRLYDITKNCLESVAAQTVPVEIFLIDDSSDLTGPIAEVISKNNISVHNVTWHNLAKSMNWLLREAFYELDQEWAVILNNDVVLDPTAIECLEKYFKQRPKHWLVAATEKCGHMFFPFSGFAINRKLFETIGPFDERFPYNLVDVDYILRFKEAYFHGDTFTGEIETCKDWFLHHEHSSTAQTINRAEYADIGRLALENLKKKWTGRVGSSGPMFEEYSKRLSVVQLFHEWKVFDEFA